MANFKRGGSGWSALSMFALVIIAVVLAVNFILGRFGVSLGRIGEIMMLVAEVIAYSLIAVYAYSWARSKRGVAWLIVFWICLVIVLVFAVLIRVL